MLVLDLALASSGVGLDVAGLVNITAYRTLDMRALKKAHYNVAQKLVSYATRYGCYLSTFIMIVSKLWQNPWIRKARALYRGLSLGLTTELSPHPTPANGGISAGAKGSDDRRWLSKEFRRTGPMGGAAGSSRLSLVMTSQLTRGHS
jgi:hypothetical protein